MKFIPVIGLEIHVQLKTRTKMFCRCSTDFNAPPNTQTCPTCLGLPGALPVLNKKAVEMGVKTALAFDCKINEISIFSRKNYFYPDLPKGYQITQYCIPLAENGIIRTLTGKRYPNGNIVYSNEKKIRIARIHLEEDSGKSIHDKYDGTGQYSYIDFNRSGVPLLEIVSEPDFHSSQEVFDFLSQMRRTLIFLGVSDCSMEKGSLRCDANVSLCPFGQMKLGVKTEIKNLNSFNYLRKALDYEIKRQEAILTKGGLIRQETRHYEPATDKTHIIRSKEEEQDYRYFPEPDLPPLKINNEWIEKIKKSIRELPVQKQERYVREYGLDYSKVLLLCSSPEMAAYFEDVMRLCNNPGEVAKWMLGDFTAWMKRHGKSIKDVKLNTRHLAELIKLLEEGKINRNTAHHVFEEMMNEDKNPLRIISEKNLSQVNEEKEIARIVDKILVENDSLVEQYRAGKDKLFNFFMGLLMKETRGRANQKILSKLLKNRLKK